MTRVRPRLIVADDHRVVVEGLQQRLRRRYEVAAVAYSGEELLSVLRQTAANILLLDLSLPGRNGLELLPDIHKIQPDLRVLVLTMHVDRVLAEASLSAGAIGFVPKDAGMDEVELAIEEVLAGRRYLSPRVPKLSHRVALDAMHASLARLTPRQQEILRFIARGKSSAEIARELGLTESTITFHRARIRQVLGLATEWELLRHAILVGLATGSEDTPAGRPRSRERRASADPDRL